MPRSAITSSQLRKISAGCGVEGIDDIKADLQQAFEKINKKELVAN